MSRQLVWSLACILLLVSRPAMCAPSSDVVSQIVNSCKAYLQGSPPSEECCAGIKELSGLAKTKEDREAICNCGKKAVSEIQKGDPYRIPPLPQKCGVTLTLPPLDPNTDCSTFAFEDVLQINS